MMTPRLNPDDQLLDFIEGRDALSQQLKALKSHPDQQAPAALDATILAQIERSLVEESNANKQVHASKLNPKKTPSFNLSLDFLFKHWAIPAGITALLVLGVTIQLRDTAQEKNPVQLAESKVQQVDERVFIPAQISTEQAAPSVEMQSPVTPQVIASEPETSMQVARKKAKSTDMLAAAKQAPAPAPTIMAEAETYAKPQTQVASADELISAKIAPTPAHAPVPVPVPVPSIATATPTPSLKILGSSGSLNRAREQNQAQAQTTIQIPASTVTQITEQEIKTVLSPATATRFAEAPLAKSAELPMNSTAPKPAVSALSAISTISTISAKPIIEEEASWLKRIEEQLKQEKNEAALKEWQAFRKAYPHANISESTLKKLHSLEQAKKEP